MRAIEIPVDYALVLHQVDEVGSEDFITLAESLDIDKARLTHIIQVLRNKGLIKLTTTAQEVWISLSAKGNRLISTVWPEAHVRFGY